MPVLTDIKDALLHLLFPHVCAGCGSNLLGKDAFLCLHCFEALPQTYFHQHRNNPVEKIFWGRIEVTAATAQFYFSKSGLMQAIMHRFKYGGHKELGFYMGQLMGHQLTESNDFNNIDAIIPLPLHKAKEHQRGFNQSLILSKGIGSVCSKPVWDDAVLRTAATESQTTKSRVARWQNMQGKFAVKAADKIKGKHLLLVDDVVTTGATLEACGSALIDAGATVSIATLCFAAD